MRMTLNERGAYKIYTTWKIESYLLFWFCLYLLLLIRFWWYKNQSWSTTSQDRCCNMFHQWIWLLVALFSSSLSQCSCPSIDDCGNHNKYSPLIPHCHKHGKMIKIAALMGKIASILAWGSSLQLVLNLGKWLATLLVTAIFLPFSIKS